MDTKRDRHSNDETRSQYSIGRRSVGTANTARSVIDLDRVLVQIYQSYGSDTKHEEIAATLYEAGLANFLEKNYSKAPDHLTLALTMYRDLQADSDDEDTYEFEITDILKTLGMVFLARKELEKARQNHQKADKENKSARNNFEQALTKKRKIYGKVVINSDIAELERYLGLTYLTETSTTTDTEAALTHLTNALRHFKLIYGEDADHVEIADTHCHLGCAYQQQNEHDQARAQFTAALAMFQEVFSDPNQVKIAETFYKVGFTYLAVGNHDKAISSFTKALDIYMEIRQTNPTIDPNYVDLSFHLGKAYCEISDFASAKRHLESAWLMYQALYRDSNSNHPSIRAAENAMRESERKREEQSAEGHVQDSTVRASKRTRDVAQTSSVPVVSVHATDESPSKRGCRKSNNPGIRQEDKPPIITTSGSGFFAKPSAAAPAPTVTQRDVRAYYLSKAGMFNASSKIFKTENLADTISELRKRAGNGGASADTLKHFGYSLT